MTARYIKQIFRNLEVTAVFCTCVLFVSSCTLFPDNSDLKRRNLGEYFQGSEAVRYFLPPLPDWANQSEAGNCKLSESIDYMRFDDLTTTYSLSYKQAIQFQYMYNIELDKLSQRASIDYIPFKEKEKLFYSVSDKIQSNIFLFIPPKFNRIHLIWIDHAIDNKKYRSELKKLMSRNEMNLGHPVFVSLCLNFKELKKFYEKNNFQEGVKLVSAEMFSPYDQNGQMLAFRGLNFSEFFNKKNLNIFLYLPIKRKPKEFIGEFNIKYY